MVVDGLMRTLELRQVALARLDDGGISKTGETDRQTDRQTDTRPLLYTVAAGGLVRTLELRQVALAWFDDGGRDRQTDRQTDRHETVALYRSGGWAGADAGTAPGSSRLV